MALPAVASPVIAGKVLRVSKQGKVEIVRPDRSVHRPGRSAPLYSGDTLVISGSGFACVETAESPTGVCWQDGRHPIVAAAPESHRPQVFNMLATWWSKPGANLPNIATSRGNEDGNATPSAPHALLPANVAYELQLMPAGYATLAPLWRGDWARVTHTLESGVATELPAGADRFEFKSVNRPAKVEVYSRNGQASGIWRVGIAPPPLVPGLSIPESAMTTTDRVDRAAWLLTYGPTQWRLFAFTELKIMANSGSYEAKVLLGYLASSDCSDSPLIASSCPFVAPDRYK
jgi:hypothetical protein